MNTFSFRAECNYDVLRFLNKAYEYAMDNNLRLGAIYLKTDEGFPDCEGEFKSNVPLHDLEEIAGSIEDCHVLLQTLRPVPLAQNSLQRK